LSGARLGDAIGYLERHAPPELAEAWDRSGLQVGCKNAIVKRVLVALDPSEHTAARAAEVKADLILTHHPLLLDPLTKIDLDTPLGRTVALLIKNDISLYSAHTNLDKADNGVNTLLARKLGLLNTTGLTKGEELYKVVFTVPVAEADALHRAVSAAGAGHIGNYRGCAYVSIGEGRFTPEEGASPAIGRVGAPERVEEARIEAIAPASALDAVRRAIAENHPYETPAVDVYPLKDKAATGALGRVGELSAEAKLGEFALFVREKLKAPGVRYAGDPDKVVGKVAVCGGSGASLWKAAMARGADVLVTGDLKYHDALDAAAAGFAIVDAGHGPTEWAACEALAALMEAFSLESGAALDVESYETRDPFTWC